MAAVEEALSANERREVRPRGQTMKLRIFESAQGDCLLLEGEDKTARALRRRHAVEHQVTRS